MAELIGDYLLIEKIGAGGMGEVWRAENAHTRVACAIKLLPLDAAADPGFVARFFDEGRLMQTLEHPHIVRVHHVGHDLESGRYYLVMDLIEGPGAGGRRTEDGGQRSARHAVASESVGGRSEGGSQRSEVGGRRSASPSFAKATEGKPASCVLSAPCSLHELVAAAKDHRLPEKDVARWARQVAEALAYAHGQGVIHRDIKPANVLIDKDGNAKVTDFGLAKAVGEEFLQSQIHQSIQHSMSGRSINSMRTVGGNGEAVSGRDGARGIELSMGELPTMGSSPSGGSAGSAGRSTADALLGTYDYMSPEQRGDLPGVTVSPASDVYAFGVMLYRLLTGRRPTGMAKPVSQLEPDASEMWDGICAKCLEHEPQDRYANGLALSLDLREGWATEPQPRKTRKVERQGRSGSHLGHWLIVAVLALVLGTAVWKYSKSVPKTQPDPIPEFVIAQSDLEPTALMPQKDVNTVIAGREQIPLSEDANSYQSDVPDDAEDREVPDTARQNQSVAGQYEIQPGNVDIQISDDHLLVRIMSNPFPEVDTARMKRDVVSLASYEISNNEDLKMKGINLSSSDVFSLLNSAKPYKYRTLNVLDGYVCYVEYRITIRR